MKKIVRFKHQPFIEATAKRYELDPLVVAAVIKTESNFEEFATRYEPEWKYFKEVRNWSKATSVTYFTEKVHQSTSWGLMQLMGTVLRELGWDGHIPEALEPRINIEYGCKKLSLLKKRYPHREWDYVASYNAGLPRINPETNQYRNQVYVDKVLDAYNELKEKERKYEEHERSISSQ